MRELNIDEFESVSGGGTFHTQPPHHIPTPNPPIGPITIINGGSDGALGGGSQPPFIHGGGSGAGVNFGALQS